MSTARWQLLRGIVSDKTLRPVTLVEIKEVNRVAGDGVFYPGDVVESDKDLSVHDKPSGMRFKKLTVIQPINEAAEDLGKMTVPALRKFAEEEGIDLGDAALKDDILETIQLACA